MVAPRATAFAALRPLRLISAPDEEAPAGNGPPAEAGLKREHGQKHLPLHPAPQRAAAVADPRADARLLPRPLRDAGAAEVDRQRRHFGTGLPEAHPDRKSTRLNSSH